MVIISYSSEALRGKFDDDATGRFIFLQKG